MPDAPTDYDPETLNLLFETLKDDSERAMTQIKSLEARGAQAFSAATVLLGLASFGSFSSAHVPTAAFAAFVIGLLSYLAAALASLILLLPAGVTGLPTAADMWSSLREYPLDSVKASLVQTIVDAEPANASALAHRVRWARVVIVAVAVEGTAIGMALLLSKLLS